MRSTPWLLLVALIAPVALVHHDALALDLQQDLSKAWFVTPLPNASYEGAPVTIDAEVEVYQGLEDAGISTIEVSVDDESIGSQDCPASCVFPNIELDQGVHEFRLTASNGYTTAVIVYVDEAPPSGETGSDTDETGSETGSESGETGGGDTNGTGDGSGDGTGDGSGATGGGCAGCGVKDEPTPPWASVALALLLLVPGFRRNS